MPAQQPPTKTGLNALEIGRGLAIVAVIYGHALAPWFMDAGDRFSEAAFLQWKFGAAFVMAFFFFVSGVGWRETESLAVALRKSATLIAIAWLASTAFDIARLLVSESGMGEAIGAPPLDIVAFLRGVARMAVFGDVYSLSGLWFLAALGVVRVLAAVMRRLDRRMAWMLGLGVLALTLASTAFYWRNIYQIHLLGVALAFFVAGRAWRTVLTELEQKPLAAYALLVASGLVLAVTFDLNQGCRWDFTRQCGEAWLGGRFGVSMIQGQFGNLPLFALTAIAGVAFASMLAIVLAYFGGAAARRLSAWGRNSLNLLIVNCLFLHVGNLLVAAWVTPYIGADNPLFFVALLTLTLGANLALVDFLARPLRRLAQTANRLAAWALALPAQALTLAAVAMRSNRVSPGP
ncbi:MAG: acyltransferase family protein [Hyphomonadaceae bacterium]